MNPGFQIGPIFFHYYGGILAISAISAYIFAKFLATKVKLPQKIVEELAIILIIPVILGARLYHVLDFWDFYAKDPVRIFFIWEGGIGIIGAIVAGIITIAIYSKLRKLNFFKLADLAATVLPLAQGVGRIGNFLNSEGFGPPTNLPWGVYIPSFKRPENFANFTHFHPTFFYESLGDFLIFLILIFLPAKIVGTKFITYLILYSALRFSLEFLRIDTWDLGIIKVAQIISVVSFFVGFALLIKIFKLKWISKSFQ